VVTAGCCASAFWAALSIVLDDHPREVRQQIHLAVIHDIAETYKEENQLELSVEELRSRIIQAWAKIWDAGMAHRDNFWRASIPHAAQAACLLSTMVSLTKQRWQRSKH
jgi:hypothetical protein